MVRGRRPSVERPLGVGSGHSAEGSSRYVVVNAKVLLDSADALQEVIDFFRETRNVPGSDFECVEPKTDVFELGLNICESIAHLDAQRFNIVLCGHLRENEVECLDDLICVFVHS
jgi:hypothetical protein